jgi:hypothetical protein
VVEIEPQEAIACSSAIVINHSILEDSAIEGLISGAAEADKVSCRNFSPLKASRNLAAIMTTAPDGVKAEAVVEVGSTSVDDEQLSGRNNDQSEKKGSRLRRLLWDSLDKSPEERAFVNKADWFIMSYICVAYFIKYLDQQK